MKLLNVNESQVKKWTSWLEQCPSIDLMVAHKLSTLKLQPRLGISVNNSYILSSNKLTADPRKMLVI